MRSLKQIPSIPGCVADRLGNIYSTVSAWGVRPKPLKLSAHPDKDGYQVVQFTRGGIKKGYRVHMLIAETFIGPRPEGSETRHLDGDVSNNRATNLRWGTRKQNADDRERHNHTARGENGGTARLTNAQVRTIKRRLNSGHLQKDLAARYGVHKTTIQAISAGRNWGWI